MIPELYITHFLEKFNKNDKIHRRTYEMLLESTSDPSGIKEITQLLVDSGVNMENLKYLLDKLEDSNESTMANAVFEDTMGIRHNFASYNDFSNDETAIKRPKMLESSSEEAGFEIPGLAGELYQEDVGKEGPMIINSENNHRIIQNDQLSRLPDNDQGNKRVLSDTVFYQSILPDLRSGQDKQKDRDPYYLFPVLQCKLCGLRFPKDYSESFGQHIEDHRRFTHALGEKTILRREFFSTKAQMRIEKLDLEVEGTAEDVVWEEESPNCAVCGKIIKKRWNDELENWVLDDGTKINEQEVAHRKCVY